jgi:cytidine deaminase
MLQSEGTRSFIALAVTRCVLHFFCLLRSDHSASPSDVDSAISPCGICRQFIREFCALNMPIVLVPAKYSGGGERIIETTVEGLLPHSFGPEHLEMPRTS